MLLSSFSLPSFCGIGLNLPLVERKEDNWGNYDFCVKICTSELVLYIHRVFCNAKAFYFFW